MKLLLDWAQLRRAGRPSGPELGLDGDVLLAAQALAEEAVIVSPNVRHFEPMVTALDWTAVSTPG